MLAPGRRESRSRARCGDLSGCGSPIGTESHEPRGAEILERLLEGGTIEQIAAEFGMTQAAVRKAKQRAKERLREIVREQIGDEGFAG